MKKCNLPCVQSLTTFHQWTCVLLGVHLVLLTKHWRLHTVLAVASAPLAPYTWSAFRLRPLWPKQAPRSRQMNVQRHIVRDLLKAGLGHRRPLLGHVMTQPTVSGGVSKSRFCAVTTLPPMLRIMWSPLHPGSGPGIPSVSRSAGSASRVARQRFFDGPIRHVN